MHFLSGQYLLDPAPPPPQFPYLWPWVIFFLLMGMVGTTYAFAVEEQHHKLAPFTRMVKRLRDAGWIITILGLLFIGIRVGDAQIPIVRSRLVMYLLALAYVGMGLYVAYYVRTVLPKVNAAYEQNLLRRQYMRRSRRRR